jgi:hypothetical protein
MLLAAIAPVDVGPATHALAAGSAILRYTLGIFSMAAEVMCGYKLWRVRTLLLSPTARAVRERDHCERHLIGLHAALEGTRVEADVRRHYRVIGARQFLAWEARAEERALASHIKRGVIGALIGLAVILTLLFVFGARLSAAPSVPTTIIVPDLSLSVSPENFRGNLGAVAEILARLRPGDRALVVGITNSFGQPAILFDKTIPASVGWLEAQAGRETFASQWQNVARQLKPTYAHTDIFGSLSVISNLAGAISPGTRVFILSDLQQSTAAFDFEHLNRIPVSSTITRLKQANAIPALTGTDVFLMGVDPVGKSAEYFLTLKAFWLEFFRESGARVRVFSIDRHVPEF